MAAIQYLEENMGDVVVVALARRVSQIHPGGLQVIGVAPVEMEQTIFIEQE